MRQRAPIAVGSNFSRSKQVNASDLVNLYYELAPNGSKSQGCLYGAAGLVEFCDLGTNAPVHAMRYSPKDDLVYAISDDKAWRIDSGGGAISLGSVGTVSSSVYMEDNGSEIFTLNPVNSTGYILTPSTLTQITDPDFVDGGSAAVINGFGVFSKKDIDEFFLSILRNAASYDPLSFATAEAAPDKVVRVFSTLNEVWFFGAATTEPYRNTGGAFPLTPIVGAENDYGCAAPFSVASSDKVILWLSDRFTVLSVDQGYNVTKVSTDGMDDEIRKLSRKSDAISYCHSENGHNFYTLTFPEAAKTYCLDLTTGQWHRRRTYGKGRLRANCFTRAFEKNLVGDFENGKIYALDPDVVADGDLVQEAEFTLPPLTNDGNSVIIDEIMIDAEAGNDPTHSDYPQNILALRRTEDGGITWSQEVLGTLGRKGERRAECVFRKLGRGNNLSFRGRMSYPAKRAIASINAKWRLAR